MTRRLPTVAPDAETCNGCRYCIAVGLAWPEPKCTRYDTWLDLTDDGPRRLPECLAAEKEADQ